MKSKGKFVSDCVGAKIRAGDYVALMSSLDHFENKMRVGFVSDVILSFVSKRIVVVITRKDGTPKKVTISKLNRVIRLPSCIAESIVSDRAIVNIREEAMFINRVINNE